METAANVVLMGWYPGLETPSVADLHALDADFRLARILLRRGLVDANQLASAVLARNDSGLLLEYCLVQLGIVPFDTMLEVMAERRATAPPTDSPVALPAA